MNEAAIIAEIRAGDTEKFGVLYDSYFLKIYNYLFYRTREKQVAEDLVSATFFKAIEHIKRFDENKGNFSAWLYRIARNTLYDHYRSRKINSSLEDAEPLFAVEDVEGGLSDRELAKSVKELFVRLPEEQREILTMRIWDGLSYAEIGEALGKSEASCKVSFHRGIKKLRELAPIAAVFAIFFHSLK